MYGLIHNCVRHWVMAKYGEDKWTHILRISQVEEERTFLNFQCYPDKATMALISVVVQELDLDVDNFLRMIGEHFVDFTIEKGYGEMLRTLGRDFRSFLDNLDYLHCYLMSTAFPGIVMPSFVCNESDEANVLYVEYYSRRKGLHTLAIGAMSGCARRFYNMEAKFEVVRVSEEGCSDGEQVQHATFRVTLLGDLNSAESTTCSQSITNGLADKKHSQTNCELISINKEVAFSTCQPRASLSLHVSSGSKAALGVNFISKEVFSKIHPYHFIFNRDLTIEQYGFGLHILCPDVRNFPSVNSLLELVWPYTTLSYENLERFKNVMFQFAVIKGTTQTIGTILKGNIIFLENSLLMFLGTPAVKSLKELADKSLKLSDIPCSDSSRELILLKHQRSTEFDLMQRLECTTAELKRTGAALELEKEKTDRLLHSMLPREVAHKLKLGEKVQESFDSATILFSDIVTFTTIASKCQPHQIVSMLNDMYTRFDMATENNKVYKVETIGDAYMVVGGVPTRVSDHATRVIRQAIDMVQLAKEVSHPITGEPLQIRVGVHTGPTVAGVVGHKMPRYCLFGDSVNVASRMESHGVPGRIHISDKCHRKLEMESAQFKLQARGVIDVKGKGQMQTFFVESPIEGREISGNFRHCDFEENRDFPKSSVNSAPPQTILCRQPIEREVTISRRLSASEEGLPPHKNKTRRTRPSTCRSPRRHFSSRCRLQ